MRNNTTDSLGMAMTDRWRKCTLTVNEFISSIDGAFDTEDLHEVYGEMYAGFHMVHYGKVVSYYYVGSRSEWFAKY